jgi:aspartate 1-decarboxylase
MVRTLMHAKLHGARVTDCNLDYVGSITIDRALMEAVGLLPYEQVQVVNKANGARMITYVIEGAAGSGSICVNGAAARHVERGDEILVIAYGQFTEEEARTHRARVAFLSPENRVVELND